MNSICLIDAKNFLYRNHYTHRELRGPDGEPTSVLYGCMVGMLNLAKRIPKTPMIMVWDGGGETWRHRYLSGHKRQELAPKPQHGTDWVGKQVATSINFLMKPQTRASAKNATFKQIYGSEAKSKVEKPVGYKANRMNADSVDDRVVALAQIPEFKQTLRSIGLRNYKINGLEGDDLIGILATAILKYKLFDDVFIHSMDTDFYQLLWRKGIRILKRIGPDGDLEWVDQENVFHEYHVAVDEWTKYRALTGDKSDNIPQLLWKVGPVRALKLLRAGVDASLERSKVPQRAINALMDITKGQLDIDDFWQKLRMNHMACKILTADDFKAPMMDDTVIEKVSRLATTLNRDMLLREGQRSADEYKEFCDWCTMHGMMDLRRRASEFAAFI